MPDELDLWPDDIAETKITPPVTILREQAALLGRKTNQLVRGHIDSSSYRGTIVHTFQILVPALDYSLELFEISHGVALYPLDFRWHDSTTEIEGEDSFIAHLKTVLQSKDTKTVIHSLLAQVKSDVSLPKAQTSEIKDEDIPF